MTSTPTYEAVSVMYAAAAAHARGDQEAVSLLLADGTAELGEGRLMFAAFVVLVTHARRSTLLPADASMLDRLTVLAPDAQLLPGGSELLAMVADYHADPAAGPGLLAAATVALVGVGELLRTAVVLIAQAAADGAVVPDPERLTQLCLLVNKLR